MSEEFFSHDAWMGWNPWKKRIPKIEKNEMIFLKENMTSYML